MFTDIINQFENIAEAVKQSELQEVPFRHLFVREPIAYAIGSRTNRCLKGTSCSSDCLTASAMFSN